MIRNLKAAFGLSLLAALILSAVSVMGASAITNGHFVSDSPSGKTKLDITEATGTSHQTQLNAYGAHVTCHDATYTAHHIGTTAEAITVTPSYINCTDGNNNPVHITMNGCHYEFTPRTSGHATAHFRCPLGNKAKVTVTDSSGSSISTMQFGAQTPSGGVVYETITTNNKHAITANITIEGIVGECHGLCQIFGTNTTTGKLTGAVTVAGTNTEKLTESVNVTVT